MSITPVNGTSGAPGSNGINVIKGINSVYGANGVNGIRPVLEARDLTKHFPVHRGGRGSAVHAVEDVTLALAASGITAVVGESGSGKSTLARLLARLIEPTAGAVLLDGAAPPTRLRYARQVQLVLQDPFSSLNPVHSVRYHLARPLRVHGLASRANLDGQIADLLGRVALTPADQFAAKYPHELSGGQRQRVAIARALAVRPRVLLADEPVSMLDVSIRLGILNLLAGLRDRDGLSILYVTHDIASARYLADEIAVMYAGQVIESGPAAQVTDVPAHPYTQLLLSAAPDPDRAQPPSLAGRGAPPNLIRPPSGCRFHPRCPHAMKVCADEGPAAIEIAPGHSSACWLHAPGLTAAQTRPLPAGHAVDGPGRVREADEAGRIGGADEAGRVREADEAGRVRGADEAGRVRGADEAGGPGLDTDNKPLGALGSGPPTGAQEPGEETR